MGWACVWPWLLTFRRSEEWLGACRQQRRKRAHDFEPFLAFLPAPLWHALSIFDNIQQARVLKTYPRLWFPQDIFHHSLRQRLSPNQHEIHHNSGDVRQVRNSAVIPNSSPIVSQQLLVLIYIVCLRLVIQKGEKSYSFEEPLCWERHWGNGDCKRNHTKLLCNLKDARKAAWHWYDIAPSLSTLPPIGSLLQEETASPQPDLCPFITCKKWLISFTIIWPSK